MIDAEPALDKRDDAVWQAIGGGEVDAADEAPETTREQAASVDTENDDENGQLKKRNDEVVDAHNDDRPPETEGGADE